jgi:hypothetical protein
MFRYNLRKMKDPTRFTFSLTQMEGRLTYKHLIKSNEVVTRVQVAKEMKRGFKHPVLQIKNGVVVGRFESINEAATATGAKKQNIHRVLLGRRQTHHGFEWKYE